MPQPGTNLPVSMSKVALICGYGPGVSAAVAQKLGSEGFKLALVSRTQSKLDAAAAELSTAGYAAKGYAADLSDAKAVRAAVAAAQKDLGPVHVLSWNAYGALTGWLEATAQQMVESYNSIVGGLVIAVQACYEDLKATKGAVLVAGTALSLEDDAATTMGIDWGVSIYAVEKAAQRKLVHVMHKQLARDGIYVAEVTICNKVKYTVTDPEGTSPLTTDDVAHELWSVYTQREPDTWFVMLQK